MHKRKTWFEYASLPLALRSAPPNKIAYSVCAGFWVQLRWDARRGKHGRAESSLALRGQCAPESTTDEGRERPGLERAG